ncbi:MAG: hypothetical protein KatS3mg068_2403 [Candidatus Sericytochromatia bacterium]|nr:MAG: hypothetical protein KatS3mg068_2403 [Candidatus Sericytochromatia bacterium]
MDNLPRPPRSLRDRKSSINQQNNIISNSNNISPNLSNNSSSYLEEIEKNENPNNSKVLNNTEVEENKDEPIIEEKISKPKVTVLNIRKNSTAELKEKLEKEREIINTQLKETIKKEIKKVEEVVEEAKEEINEVKQKTINKINKTSQKIINYTVNKIETFVDKTKDLLLFFIFRKRKTKKVLIKYSDLVKKNIEFLDYQNKSLVKGVDINSPNYEKIFLSNVIKDVRYCERFVRDIPPNTQGIYANKNLSDIFKNIKDRDIYRFIDYIYNNPDNFVGKKYKFSEAFATWIVKKSHEI